MASKFRNEDLKVMNDLKHKLEDLDIDETIKHKEFAGDTRREIK